MRWRADERTRKTFGDWTVVSERDIRGGPSALLVTLQDGRNLRVLPTDGISGQRRSRTVSAALREADELGGLSSSLFVIGWLEEAGLEWEFSDFSDSALGEWLEGWWHRMNSEGEPRPWSRLASDLARAGWEIVQRTEAAVR